MPTNYDEIRLKNIKEYGEGSRHLSYFADIYSTRTHFIYEILQNAEDALSRRQSHSVPGFIHFKLHTHGLEIRHNGAPFCEQDVVGICGIGEGTKAGDYTQIGKFGIGFKSVYAYTFFPRIRSKGEHFEIRRFVEPYGLPTSSEDFAVTAETCITLPFDERESRPKWAFRDLVPPEQAICEIGNALRSLGARTLLFLAYTEEIKWELPNGNHGHFKKNIKVNEGGLEHQAVEVTDGLKIEDWRVFRRDAKIQDGPQTHNVRVETAFLIRNGKAARAEHTELVVYFPTEKETKLGFLIQAPFKATKARDNIKTDDTANRQILEVAASLAVESLAILRDLGLLDLSSYMTLPLRVEDFPADSFFRPIYDKVRESLKLGCLLPADGGGFIHASAAKLARGKELTELFSAKQLADIFGKDKLEWLDSHITSDKFPDLHAYLVGRKKQYSQVWEIEPLIDGVQIDAESLAPRLAGAFMDKQEISWLIRFALYVKSNPGSFKRKEVPFIRLEDGLQVCLPTDNIRPAFYLPPEGISCIDLLTFPLVSRQLVENREIRSFLEKEGIHEVDEIAQIRAILQARYTAKALKPDINDIKRFVTLVEQNPAEASIFSGFLVFKRADDKWGTSRTIFLDSPFMETYLSAYYDALGEGTNKKKLSGSYQKNSIIAKERLKRFAVAVGVQTKLEIKEQSAEKHLLWKELATDYLLPNIKLTTTRISEDWLILDLERLLNTPSETLSRLIWKTLCEAQPEILKARFRPNQQYPTREAASSLVMLLRDSPWIPQQNGEFVCPAAASRTLLPTGFPFDEGYEWLRAVGFGEEEHKRSEGHRRKQSAAAVLGFADEQALKNGQWFAGLNPEVRQRFIEHFQRQQQTELPENIPRNPTQRAARVGAQAVEAPERGSEIRSRAVSVNREAVKQEAKPYLRHQYTNPNGEMICQVCKAPLPFKLNDGSYYAEHVEFLAVKNDGNGLKKHYYQNYLVVCPNHSAMFQHANGAPELMKEMFIELEGSKLEVLLGQKDATIYFTQTHIADLKKVIEVDDRISADMGSAEDEDEGVLLN